MLHFQKEEVATDQMFSQDEDRKLCVLFVHIQ